MKTRATQRVNRVIRDRKQHRKKEAREEFIKLRDECGIKDPTPFEAVGIMVRIQREMRAV